MAWVKVEPLAKPAKPTGAKLALTVGKKSSHLTVALDSAVCGAHGWDVFDHADIFFGDGDDAGKMMITPSTSGYRKLARFKSAVILRVPEQKGWPNASAKLGIHPVTWDGNSCVVALPAALRGAMKVSQPKTQELVASAAAAGAPEGLTIAGTVLSINRRYANLTGSELQIFRLMHDRWGEPARRQAIIAALYGDDPNGGPDDAVRVIDQFIFKLRKKLSPLGINVITHSGFGWSLAMSPEA